MSKCRKCEKDVVLSKDGVKCGGCLTVFHEGCVNDSIGGDGQWSTWKCEDCALETKSSTVKMDDHNPNIVPVLEAIASFRQDSKQRWDSNDNKLDSVQSDIHVLQSEITTMKAVFSVITSRTNVIEERVNEVLINNNKLEEELKSVKSELTDLQEQTRKNNLLVTGIPVTPKENVYDILKAIAEILHVTYDRADISTARRLPTREGDRNPPSIVVAFLSRSIKARWIFARRMRKSLSASEINEKFPNHQVYLNDHLTPQARSIFNGARALIRTGKLSKVWTSDGHVLAKRTPMGQPFRVISLEDLKDGMQPSQTPVGPPQHTMPTYASASNSHS